MILPFHTFALNGDAIFGLIAMAIWVWLSVVGKRAKANQKTPPPTEGPIPGEAQSPQDELKKFFEDLEKGLNAPPTADLPEPERERAPPPPLPPPPKRAAHPAPRPRPRPAPAMAPPPPPVVTAPEEVPALAELPPLPALPELWIEEPAPARAAPAPKPQAKPPSRPRLDLLRSREGLQSAIVASEVLAPPLALRR